MIRKLLFLLTFLALHACDFQDEMSFDEWDADGDGTITKTEFDRTWTEQDYFANWDTNGDGQAEPDEWNVGLQRLGYDSGHEIGGNFNMWDANDDRRLNEEELRDNLYDDWDSDGNGTISQTEYENRFA